MRVGRRFAGIVFLVVAMLGTGVALSETPLATVQVVGTRVTGDGGYILCTGSACADILASMASGPFFEEQYAALYNLTPVDRGEFCRALKANAPEYCNVSDPPASPGLGNWQPNGCGSGGWDNVMAHAGAYVAFGGNYSGDLDAPHEGVSFTAACNSHDQCWGAARNKTVCDETFLNAMRSACSVSAGTSVGVCNGFASAWHSAVATTTTAQKNYKQDVSRRQCGLFAKDLKDNECS